MPADPPQSFGLEGTEFLVAGHAGSISAEHGIGAMKVEAVTEISLPESMTAEIALVLDLDLLVYDESDGASRGTIPRTPVGEKPVSAVTPTTCNP